MFAFELWREFKLSIAEIYSLFPKMEIIYFDEKILIVDNLKKEKVESYAKIMWWSIKIIEIDEIFKSDDKFLQTLVYDYIANFFWNKKNHFALNFYWKANFSQKEILVKAKKYFQKKWISSRFVNNDFKNIKSYQIIKEKLVEKKTDFNLIFAENNVYVWNTIFVQNIDEYSKRDFWKSRDMQVGMLPPKLAQIMINLSKNKDDNTIYDPFCWLGTILLESIIWWNYQVFGSDISQKCVDKTTKNIEFIKNSFENNLKKFEVIKFDARNIAKSPILSKYKITSIVTEWFLWEIFWEKNINLEKIEKAKNELLPIYKDFLTWLNKIKFDWNIVFSLPFWEFKGKYYYFNEIYEIIKKYFEIQKILPNQINSSKMWSLLYKRAKQTVWREIFVVKVRR